MARILVVGDTHGSYTFFADVCRWANVHDCDFILQVGDFGFVWKENREGSFADRIYALDSHLRSSGQTLMWLDGNHENFDVLREHFGAHPDQEHAVQMSDFITYLPRGYRFEVDGVKCMSFGGACSIDQDMRVTYQDWWPQEMITPEQVERVSTDPVDIMFTHDCPVGGPALDSYLAPDNWGLPARLENLSYSNRLKLRMVLDKVKPKLLIHGHYHHRYNDRIDDTLIMGLGCNFDKTEAITVVDTEDERFG